MSLIDILFRVDEICKKYDKYDVDKLRELNAAGDDPFTRLYDTIDSEIETAIRAKGITKEDMVARSDLAIAIGEKIQLIPDGSNVGGSSDKATTSNPNHIKFDLQEAHLTDEFFQESEESSQFRQEYEMRKLKQDEGLDVISEGLETLKNLAHDMNEELDKQVPLIDEIDTKVDKARSDLRNTNVRLKHTLHQV
ncbi:hypothetical protein KSS87_006300 [Heliosperma pusillum]|nr:hypothetical protein KSS87_006300 [Heliosperma pusillum]